MKSPKTTIAGLALILGALSKAGTEFASDKPIDLETLIGGIVAGCGLLAARDNNVTSEEAGAKDAELRRLERQFGEG